MASPSEAQSSYLDVWEVEDHIYNASEFESEKENENQPIIEDELHESNEAQGEEDNIEKATEVINQEVFLAPHVGMLFDSMDEAYDYYNQYAYKKGFSVKKGAIRKSEKDGNVIG
ncbi:putative protein FAR1-RELATED SEQUENCE 10 [Dioscorea cayenensis subsp. rotundata]|uniref:Protein FAR1-RELATED SEQUENCE n=1 Tax=Dioscorea cayennensis subsp. rotundata TaxID=55577 RepID=A0AB40ARW9_DIOCR|nr:putative protein FAR1-RELATED SEQUENCE 10 [Dioscorea cayenensis subsp. rotundata]